VTPSDAAAVGRARLVRLRSHYRERIRTVAPTLALLGGALLVNRVARSVGPELSWLIGWNVTGLIYGIGVLCYVVFIAYGPRNLMPEMVESLLYTSWPQSQLLMTQVNTNTNVFPSLHASLSLTVAALAYRTREVYPRWLFVAIFLAANVVVSTMYLGIHWLLDVVAGGVLALVAVRWAPALSERLATPRRFVPLAGWTASLLGNGARYLRDVLNVLRSQ